MKESYLGHRNVIPKEIRRAVFAALTQKRQNDLYVKCRTQKEGCVCRVLQCRQWPAQVGRCLLAGVPGPLWCHCQLTGVRRLQKILSWTKYVHAGDVHLFIWLQERQERDICSQVYQLWLTFCAFSVLHQVVSACRWRSDQPVLQPSDQKCSSAADW